jgi:putative endonuclease
MALHNEIGKKGEEIARTFLMKRGFSFVERNVRSYQGEIDLIFTRNGTWHFVEVKSLRVASIHEHSKRHIDPRDNFTKEKQRKLLLAIEYYCKGEGVSDANWQLDLVCVYMDMSTRTAKIDFIENVDIS